MARSWPTCQPQGDPPDLRTANYPAAQFSNRSHQGERRGKSRDAAAGRRHDDRHDRQHHSAHSFRTRRCAPSGRSRTCSTTWSPGATMFAISAEQGSIPDDELGKLMSSDNVGDDPKGAWDKASKRALTAFEQPGVMEKVVKLPFGEMPAGVALNIAIFDVATHCGRPRQGNRSEGHRHRVARRCARHRPADDESAAPPARHLRRRAAVPRQRGRSTTACSLRGRKI